MSDKQKLRNELTRIEDEARRLRNDDAHDNSRLAFALIVKLTQLVREEIVK